MAVVCCDNFNDFSLVLYNDVMQVSKQYSRVDVVFDRYFPDSLKEPTRTNRGVGTKYHFTDETSFPTNFREHFLHHSENKEDL